MTGDKVMTIGRFARISGLSIHTLRHYDDVGLCACRDRPRKRLSALPPRAGPPGPAHPGTRRIDLPVEDIRTALADSTGETMREFLPQHRGRLERKQGLMAAQIADIDYYQQKGLSMTPATRARPVQLKIAVADVDEAITFYQQAFGFHYDITRSTDEGDYSSFMFSKYGERDFFLIHLLDETAVDRPGPTTFGFLVDDLDATHARALTAGATEVINPHEAQGMPRNSAVK